MGYFYCVLMNVEYIISILPDVGYINGVLMNAEYIFIIPVLIDHGIKFAQLILKASSFVKVLYLNWYPI